MNPIFQAKDLVKSYRHTKRLVKAVDSVNLTIQPGERVGIVGESGSGKSTLIRMLAALSRPTMGELLFDGKSIIGTKERELGDLRSRVQIVFQDPRSSLDPRMKIGKIITEPLRSPWVKGRPGVPSDSKARLAEVLEQVGLSVSDARKYPHEFSGGQRQRIAIARALASKPEVLIADEAVSALDVSVRAQVLNLFREIADKDNLTLIFVSHDLSVVRYLCRSVLVMRNGQIVETGSTEDVLQRPTHPYTKQLLAAVPHLSTGKVRLAKH